MHNHSPALPAARGFTLIEMVVTLTILAILGAVTAYGISHGVRAYMATPEIVDTLSKLRVSSERLAREIRSVRRNPANPAAYHFTSRTGSGLTFTRLESDGTTVTTVSIDGSSDPLTLEYSSPSGQRTLTDQLNSLSFSYYQSDGVTPATSNTDIAFVEFELVLSDVNGNNYPQRTRVALRNQQ